MTPQDLPVVLHNDNRGLLTVEEGKLDVLQLSADGRRESPMCH
jgi:sphingosine kinase